MLANVAHPDQTYTFWNRTIFDYLYLVRDILELGCRDSLLFALLSMNQEKVFNRVDHGYLLGTLWAFSFRPQFVGSLQVFYASVECLVKLNWILTEPVSFRYLWKLDPVFLQIIVILFELKEELYSLKPGEGRRNLNWGSPTSSCLNMIIGLRLDILSSPSWHKKKMNLCPTREDELSQVYHLVSMFELCGLFEIFLVKSDIEGKKIVRKLELLSDRKHC
ncbi:unnamed protein product [Caretta caretta]